MENRLVGQIGENTAADILRAKGYTILKRNYRCKHGEQATQIRIQPYDSVYPLNSLISMGSAD